MFSRFPCLWFRVLEASSKYACADRLESCAFAGRAAVARATTKDGSARADKVRVHYR